MYFKGGNSFCAVQKTNKTLLLFGGGEFKKLWGKYFPSQPTEVLKKSLAINESWHYTEASNMMVYCLVARPSEGYVRLPSSQIYPRKQSVDISTSSRERAQRL